MKIKEKERKNRKEKKGKEKKNIMTKTQYIPVMLP
jgi:hypothetical protein